MKRVDVKKAIVYVAAILAAAGNVAGVYPFVPGVFVLGFMLGLNRSLLFLCSLAGLFVFVPLVSMIKYMIAIFAAVIWIKGMEWYRQSCPGWVAAIIGGATVFAAGQFCAMLHLKDASNLAISILEALFVAGFVQILVRYGYLFFQWEPFRRPAPQILVGGGRRLAYYAESFEKLSKTFGQMNRYKEDFTAEELGRMQSEVAGRVCVTCGQCGACWEQENAPMYQVLYRFLQKLQAGTLNENSAQEIQQYCPYSNQLIGQVMQIFEKASLNMAWYNRLQENREVIAQQLDAMAYIMEDCARENEDISQQEGRLIANIKYYCREQGILFHQIKVMKTANGKKILYLQCRSGSQRCIPVRELAKQFSGFGEERFVALQENPVLLGDEEAVLAFAEDDRYAVYHGLARRIKDGEQISGDNFSFLSLQDGHFVMSLSDGMGSGMLASRESEMVIDLLEKFLEAGFHPDAAIKMMNSAMVTHGEHNLFSTVDVADIDLDSGRCSFYKVGGISSFIKRKNLVEQISCVNPPVGFLSKMEIQTADVCLEQGEFVIMVSDGVLEHLYVEQAEETMMDIISDIETTNARQMAKQILDRILLYTGGTVRDDMTVLVAGLWEKDT